MIGWPVRGPGDQPQGYLLKWAMDADYSVRRRCALSALGCSGQCQDIYMAA